MFLLKGNVMFKGTLICKETGLVMQARFYYDPKPKEGLKIKRRISNKTMNVYEYVDICHATYEFNDFGTNASEDQPAVKVEVRLKPVYYNYHHRASFIEPYRCGRCDKWCQNPMTPDPRNQTGECECDMSEKFKRTTRAFDICLTGFRAMRNEMEQERSAAETEDLADTTTIVESPEVYNVEEHEKDDKQ